MANYTFVRSVGTPVTATGTTVTFTVGASGAASGDLVAVFVASTTATNATGITDSGGNVYVRARAQTLSGLDGEIWLSRLTGALVSTNTIVVAFAGSQAASICVLEFAGGTGQLVDVANSGTNTADVTPASTVTPTATNALVLGLRAAAGSGTEDVTSTNYTAGANKATSVPSIYAEYSIETTIAARTLNGQWSISGSNLSVNVAVFNVPAAASTVPPLAFAAPGFLSPATILGPIPFPPIPLTSVAATVAVAYIPPITRQARFARPARGSRLRRQQIGTPAAPAVVTVAFVPPIARPPRFARPARGSRLRRQQPGTPQIATATYVQSIQAPVRRRGLRAALHHRQQPQVPALTPVVTVTFVPSIARPVRRGLWARARQQPALPNQSVTAVQAVFLPDIASAKHRTGFTRRGHLVTFTVTQTAATPPSYVPPITRPARRALVAGRRQQPVTQTVVTVTAAPQIAHPRRRRLWARPRGRVQPATPTVVATFTPIVRRTLRLAGIGPRRRRQPTAPPTVVVVVAAVYVTPVTRSRQRFNRLRRRQQPATPITPSGAPPPPPTLIPPFAAILDAHAATTTTDYQTWTTSTDTITSTVSTTPNTSTINTTPQGGT